MKERMRLTWNVGSSSLKAALLRGDRVVQRWQADLHTKTLTSSSTKGHADIASHEEAVQIIFCQIASTHIDQHLHRIVYGGPSLWKPAKISTSLLHTLPRFVNRDPLHLPHALRVLHLVERLWPKTDGYCVFDSGIYEHLPLVAREYALPRWVVEKYHIRRYGFHGISHWWAAQRIARQQKKKLSAWSGITVHLGSGSSITVWKHGRPIDTSMGFSPLGGPMMATRSGDLDPLLPLFFVRQAGMTPARVEQMLQTQSGIFAMTGSPDLRDALSALGHHQPEWPPAQRLKKDKARLGLDMLTYEVARYIGSYVALLERCDGIVFTGAIGKNPYVRKQIMKWLHHRAAWKQYVVPADEERAMVSLLESVV